ncbi:MAG: thiamine phosphate synthase [Melioribacter sp.]|nr:thiamine phosphate synthase [Melioribacter sp.]
MSKIDFKLYLVTNRKLCKFLTLEEILGLAADYGVKAIQIRENDLSDDELIYLTKKLTSKIVNKVKFFINNNLNVVNNVSVHGIHCKENGLNIKLVKYMYPKHLIGVSCHSLESAFQAENEGADFIVFGPIFSTPSKINYGNPQGIDKLAEITSSIKLPVFAIGGVTPDRVKECLSAGAAGVAVMSTIMEAKDLVYVLNQYRTELNGL